MTRYREIKTGEIYDHVLEAIDEDGYIIVVYKAQNSHINLSMRRNRFKKQFERIG